MSKIEQISLEIETDLISSNFLKTNDKSEMSKSLYNSQLWAKKTHFGEIKTENFEKKVDENIDMVCQEHGKIKELLCVEDLVST